MIKNYSFHRSSILFQFNNSCRNVSRSSSSFTFFMISPFLIRRPSPIPPAIPISASLRLSRTVHYTSHNGNFEYPGEYLQPSSPPRLQGRIRSNPRPAAGRTGHNFDPAFSQPQCLQESALQLRISSTGSPVKETRIVSPIPSYEDDPQAYRRFYISRINGSRFCNSDMKRIRTFVPRSVRELSRTSAHPKT